MLTFIGRMSGIFLAASVCAGGIVGAFFAAQYQHENLAISIAVSCIGTLAVASLHRKH